MVSDVQERSASTHNDRAEGNASVKPRILFADDHRLVLEALSKILESNFDIVGTVHDGLALLEQVESLRPDLVLLDISLPGMNGLDAASKIADKFPNIKLVFLTMHSNMTYLREAFRAGACGFVLKSAGASELSSALQIALSGGTYVSPGVRQRTEPSTPGLTPRQREVLHLLACGSSAKEIGSALNISTRTAEFHKVSIMQKLGIRTTAQLTRFAVENGLG
jgi:DNA-binding NarL/FixJ family response regulator